MATSYLTKNKAQTGKKKASPKTKAVAETAVNTAAAKPKAAKPASAKPKATTPASAKPKVATPKAAMPTGRMVAKESPLKGMAVEQWIKEKTTGWQTEAAGRILGLVRKAAPDAIISIKWAQPVFESNGPFAYIRPAKAHLTFGFWRGTEMTDPKKLLSGDGDRMAHMKLTSLDQIDAATFSAMIKEAVKLNREKGNPALRSKK